MKKIVSLATALFLLLPTLTPTVSAIAEATDTGGSNSTAAQNKERTTLTDEEKAALKARVEEYKKKFAQTLTEAVKKRVGERCVASQGVIKNKRQNAGTASEKHTAIYDRIIASLEKVVTSAKANGQDTTALEGHIATLKTKIETFKAAVTNYQEGLQDLANIKCTTDPTAFKAALEATRADQKAVLDAAKDVRSFWVTSIKPELKALKENSSDSN